MARVEAENFELVEKPKDQKLKENFGGIRSLLLLRLVSNLQTGLLVEDAASSSKNDRSCPYKLERKIT